MERHKPRMTPLRGFGSFSKVMTSGTSVQLSPIRAFYVLTPSVTPKVETGFSVTKSIRSAASRNYVKRRLRESFRKNSTILCSGSGVEGTLRLVLLYTKRAANIRKEIKSEAINNSIAATLSMIRNKLAEKK